MSDRSFYVVNAVLSAAALAFLTYILVLRPATPGGAALDFMPAVNASFNALSAGLVLAGLVAIKRRRPDIHRLFMVGAFFSSALFLVGYLIYHYVHGDTRYPGTGTLKIVYLVILASHVLLSIAVLPLVLTTFFFALKRDFVKHRRVAKFTYPIWLYVSVTGVVVYFFLRSA